MMRLSWLCHKTLFYFHDSSMTDSASNPVGVQACNFAQDFYIRWSHELFSSHFLGFEIKICIRSKTSIFEGSLFSHSTPFRSTIERTSRQHILLVYFNSMTFYLHYIICACFKSCKFQINKNSAIYFLLLSLIYVLNIFLIMKNNN